MSESQHRSICRQQLRQVVPSHVRRLLQHDRGQRMTAAHGQLCAGRYEPGICQTVLYLSRLYDIAFHRRHLVQAADFLCRAMQTQATIFSLGGVSSLVMRIVPSSAAANAVAANPGHPHIALWLASGTAKPMVITIRPAWFSDGSPFYMYVPGEFPMRLSQH